MITCYGLNAQMDTASSSGHARADSLEALEECEHRDKRGGPIHIDLDDTTFSYQTAYTVRCTFALPS